MDIPKEHEEALQEWLDKTPGGAIMLMDLLFHEECTPNEPTMSSYMGLQDQLDELKALMKPRIEKFLED